MSFKMAGILFIATGVLLIAGSAGAMLSAATPSSTTEQSNRDVVEQIKDTISSTPAPTPNTGPTSPLAPKIEITGNEDSPDPAPAPTPQQEPAFPACGKDYIGILTIPAIGVDLPVLREYSETNLSLAPCLYSGSVSDNNAVIVAHNYNQHFGRLKKINCGDEVVFTDLDGVRHVYRVIGTETLAPNETDSMMAGEWDLTLFTCTNTGLSRLTIRCRKAA